MSSMKDGIIQIDKTELKELLKNRKNDQVILDVREPFEYDEGHIPGVPLLTMRRIPFLLEGFNKDKEYILICRSGNRSMQSSLFLKEQGIEKVISFEGGMLKWDGELNFGRENEINDIKDLNKV